MMMMFCMDREPALDDLLEDPATQLLMRRDGVDEAMLRDLLAAVSRTRAEHREIDLPA
jgi:hypothetical protein